MNDSIFEEVKVESRNIFIPKDWSVGDFKEFTGKVDEYFEGNFGPEDYWTWTKLGVSSYGLMLEVDVRLGQASIGEVYFYQNENSEDEDYYIFDGCDIFPAVPGENDVILDKLSDVADAVYDMLG